MFNFLSKPLILALFVSLSLNGLFGYLSYHFYGEGASALLSLEVALDVNKSLENSLEKQETACKIADSVSSEFQSDKKQVEDKTKVVLDKIDNLTSKKAAIASNKAAEVYVGVHNEKPNVAGLDDLLPVDLQRVLSESYHSLQRQGGSDAR